MCPLLCEFTVQLKGNLVMYVKHCWYDGAKCLVGVLVKMICFSTEILILSKYSENISAHAQRINTSQLQCKSWLACFFFFLQMN